MVTMEPGPDISPYHDRQIVILERSAWADWLDPAISAKSPINPFRPARWRVGQVGYVPQSGTGLSLESKKLVRGFNLKCTEYLPCSTAVICFRRLEQSIT